MTRPKHKQHKHAAPKAPSKARRASVIAAPIACVALAVTGVVVFSPDDEPAPSASEESSDTADDTLGGLDADATPDTRDPLPGASRGQPAGRPKVGGDAAGSTQRKAPADEATEESGPPVAAGTRYLTADLNVRTGPGEDFELLTVLAEGSKVQITDETDGEWAQIIHEDEGRWVAAEYLSEDKPEEPEEPTGGLSDAECSVSPEVESGLVSNATSVYRAVCAEYPEVTAYGGLRPGDDGEHGTGQALDIMISGSTGDSIADFVRANASALGVSEVLWSQQIWTVERAAEGWRPMEDRGSDTANHYDHVHVTVY